MEFDVIVSNNSEVVFKVNGEVDLLSISGLRNSMKDYLEKDNCKTVIIDLADVPYIDSSGVSLLLSIQKMSEKNGKEFIIKSPSEPVQNILQLVKLDSYFKFK